MIAGRVVGALSAAAGLVLIARPHRVGAVVTNSNSPIPAPEVVRLLGARMAAQGTVELIKPDKTVLVLAAVTDVLHSGSMVGLAAFDTTYRRPALTSAAVAAANAVANTALVLARSAS